MTEFTTIDPEHPPTIPRNVAVCPICGAGLYIEDISEWEAENGRVTDTGLCIDCESMPDIETDEWDDWFACHWSMPYVDWLPVTKVVTDWFNAHFRVVDEVTAESRGMVEPL